MSSSSHLCSTPGVVLPNVHCPQGRGSYLRLFTRMDSPQSRRSLLLLLFSCFNLYQGSLASIESSHFFCPCSAHGELEEKRKLSNGGIGHVLLGVSS